MEKDPRSSGMYATEQGEKSGQILNLINTELLIFLFILKLLFSQLPRLLPNVTILPVYQAGIFYF